jgi:hypothetical protein
LWALAIPKPWTYADAEGAAEVCAELGLHHEPHVERHESGLKARVLDGTSFVTLVHQNHGYSVASGRITGNANDPLLMVNLKTIGELGRIRDIKSSRTPWEVAGAFTRTCFAARVTTRAVDGQE